MHQLRHFECGITFSFGFQHRLGKRIIAECLIAAIMQQALRKFRQLQQADNHVGQIPGIGRASGIVGTQPDFTLFRRLMQQVLNEIAAVFA